MEEQILTSSASGERITCAVDAGWSDPGVVDGGAHHAVEDLRLLFPVIHLEKNVDNCNFLSFLTCACFFKRPKENKLFGLKTDAPPSLPLK